MNWGSVERSFSAGPVYSDMSRRTNRNGRPLRYFGLLFPGYQHLRPASAGGTGLPTSKMQMKSTYESAGWDFNNVWHICETINYPKLIWQILPADIVCPDGVDIWDLAVLCQQWLLEKIPADLRLRGVTESSILPTSLYLQTNGASARTLIHCSTLPSNG